MAPVEKPQAASADRGSRWVRGDTSAPPDHRLSVQAEDGPPEGPREPGPVLLPQLRFHLPSAPPRGSSGGGGCLTREETEGREGQVTQGTGSLVSSQSISSWFLCT